MRPQVLNINIATDVGTIREMDDAEFAQYEVDQMAALKESP